MNTKQSLPSNNKFSFYSLPALEKESGLSLKRLPVSIRVVLESLLRNCDGKRVKEEDVLALAKWNAKKPGTGEVPFVVSRVILQDFTGVPLLVDLAAMRDAVADKNFDPSLIEPQVPVDLVIDHSVQVDRSGTEDALSYNLNIEFERNKERYEFLKWGQQAFKTFRVIPPGIGIVHQVNLEYLAHVVSQKQEADDTVLFPDTLVGTDSHTTMINGLGVVGWGVGGIEAEAAMLGQPVAIQTPEVIGVHLTGEMPEGVTATDLTLRVTELLRAENVVGKFVEFFGKGAATLSVADRATIANMAPEYGATIGFFPVDDKTLAYLETTGRERSQTEKIKEYLSLQGLFGIPDQGEIDYTHCIELNLSTLTSSLSGPKRPQDRIDQNKIKEKFENLLLASVEKGGYGRKEEDLSVKVCIHTDGTFHSEEEHRTGGKNFLDHSKKEPEWDEVEMVSNKPITDTVINPGYSECRVGDTTLHHGSVIIAAITSCTNTSNPSVMLAAGLLARSAVKKGLSINPIIKTSLAPGSRVVTDYLEKSDLQRYLDALGFQTVAYGCTTCIGNSGPLDEKIEAAIKKHDLVTASVLSGNRNFEARIHGAIKANFLMSPPLVVAFALAGRVDINLDKEPLGYDLESKPVFLKDIWPSSDEIQKALQSAIQPEMYKERYSDCFNASGLWQEIPSHEGVQYSWNEQSTYIQKPPFFESFGLDLPKAPQFKDMRALALFGDSVTTDHISPAGAFKPDTTAGKYLNNLGVNERDFNSYGSRRGNDRVMTRGTFANIRIRNLMADGKEGGFTKVMPEGTPMPIYDACQHYAKQNTPLIIFGGKDYGMGSSRDWAAKGTSLLGVKAVVCESFERIHRSNLIGMGVLPLQFKEGDSWQSLQITAEDTFSLTGFENGIKPMQEVTLEIHRSTGAVSTTLVCRLDTDIEVDYYLNGGILPFMLRSLIKTS